MPSAKTLPGSQIKQDIDEGIEVGNGLLVAELGPLNTQLDSQGVDAFGGGALVVELLEAVAVAVELVAEPSPRREPHGQEAAAFGPLFVMNRTSLVSGLRPAKGATVAPHPLGDQTAVVEKAGQERHRQTGGTEGEAVGIKLPLDRGPLDVRDGGKASGFKKIVKKIPGIESGIEGAKGWFEAEPGFGIGHQGKKEGEVAFIEGLGPFGQNHFAIAGHFGGDQAGGVAPIVFADTNGLSGATFGGRSDDLVRAFLATEFAISIGFGLAVFVIALAAFEVSFGIILL